MFIVTEYAALIYFTARIMTKSLEHKMWVTVTESLCIPEEYAKDNSYAK